jgi:hypothetical protein
LIGTLLRLLGCIVFKAIRADLDQCGKRRLILQYDGDFSVDCNGGPMSTPTAMKSLLTRLRDQWRARSEFASIDQSELDLIANDLGMTAKDLEVLVERGPDAANLLYERMSTLGISREDVERAAHGLMRDLERTCACCNDKGVCEKDLKSRSDDPGWKNYCPNAVSLQDLAKLKDHLSM